MKNFLGGQGLPNPLNWRSAPPPPGNLLFCAPLGRGRPGKVPLPPPSSQPQPSCTGTALEIRALINIRNKIFKTRDIMQLSSMEKISTVYQSAAVIDLSSALPLNPDPPSPSTPSSHPFYRISQYLVILEFTIEP